MYILTNRSQFSINSLLGLFYTISPKFCHAFVNEPLSNLKEQQEDMKERERLQESAWMQL